MGACMRVKQSLPPPPALSPGEPSQAGRQAGTLLLLPAAAHQPPPPRPRPRSVPQRNGPTLLTLQGGGGGAQGREALRAFHCGQKTCKNMTAVCSCACPHTRRPSCGTAACPCRRTCSCPASGPPALCCLYCDTAHRPSCIRALCRKAGGSNARRPIAFAKLGRAPPPFAHPLHTFAPPPCLPPRMLLLDAPCRVVQLQPQPQRHCSKANAAPGPLALP